MAGEWCSAAHSILALEIEGYHKQEGLLLHKVSGNTDQFSDRIARMDKSIVHRFSRTPGLRSDGKLPPAVQSYANPARALRDAGSERARKGSGDRFLCLT